MVILIAKVPTLSVQSFSCVRLFVTLWTAARQTSLSITNSQSPPKPMSIELVMPSKHLIFYHPLLLLPSIFPSIRVFSNESALHIRWPKYWTFTFTRFIISFLSWSKHLLISWLQSQSTEILEPKENLSPFSHFPHLFAMKMRSDFMILVFFEC